MRPVYLSLLACLAVAPGCLSTAQFSTEDAQAVPTLKRPPVATLPERRADSGPVDAADAGRDARTGKDGWTAPPVDAGTDAIEAADSGLSVTIGCAFSPARGYAVVGVSGAPVNLSTCWGDGGNAACGCLSTAAIAARGGPAAGQPLPQCLQADGATGAPPCCNALGGAPCLCMVPCDPDGSVWAW